LIFVFTWYYKVQDWNELTYTIPVSIGNPPQSFNLLLSISDSDLYVPSSRCAGKCGSHSHSSMNSSTHVCHNEKFSTFPLRFHCSGILSEDNLSIASFEIKYQMFVEVDRMERYMLHWKDGSWDGLLGLAPSDEDSHMGLLNPFQNMIKQKLLNENVFSLKLPRGVDDWGEILFGGVDQDLYVGELTSLQLLPYNQHYLKQDEGRWSVPATKLSIDNGTVEFDRVAVFETDFPFISLPENHVMLFDQYLDMDNAGKS
jgi:hypothetical protein